MIKLLYCNLQRKRDALDLIAQTAGQLKADFIACSEPNKIKVENSQWHTDAELDVGIMVKRGLRIKETGRGNGYVWIKHGEITIFACYISPNATFETFSNFINGLRQAARQHRNPVLVGDFNSKHRVWGSKRSDKRGNLILEWAASDILTIHNDGLKPTFVRRNQTSYIDLTLSSAAAAPLISGWAVLDDLESKSDHNYMVMDIRNKQEPAPTLQPTRLRFKPDRRENYTIELFKALTPASTPDPHRYINEIQRISDRVFRAGNTRNFAPVYWWNGDISKARKTCSQAKRSMAKANKRGNITEDLIASYKQARNHLKFLIAQAKVRSFDKLLDDVNSDPWGNAYQIVTGRCHQRSTLSEEGQLQEARKLFPGRPIIRWTIGDVVGDVIPFSEEELKSAIGTIAIGKCPGPDGLTGEMVKIALETSLHTSLRIFNQCLETGNFPPPWKIAELKLIPKPRKPGQSSVSYRPISLISVMGKALERLLVVRVNAHVNQHLAELQFGFRPGLGTSDAISAVYRYSTRTNTGEIVILLAFDIRNAFNAAPWDRIIEALRTMGLPKYLLRMIQSYFTGRILMVGGKMIRLSCGVPQGSVLGPILWNVFYNAVVSLRIPGVTIVAYADDLVLIIRGSSMELIRLTVELAVKIVLAKLASLGIELAPEKTEALIMHAPSDIRELNLTIDGHTIKAKGTMKYLGVWLERGGRCCRHIEEMSSKAERRTHALSRLLKIDGPVKERARRLYSSVILSSIVYAASAWFWKVKTKGEYARLATASRLVLIRVCAALPTVSTPAAEVVASMPPIDLRLAEICAVSRGIPHEDARRRTMSEWQHRWENCFQDKARWTRRLMPSFKNWVQRSHGEVDRYLCQLLTGHGEVGTYRTRMKLSVVETCGVCGVADTPEHAFFKCSDGEEERRVVEATFGAPARPDSVVGHMLLGAENWEAVARMAAAVVRAREKRRKDGAV